MMVNRVTNFGAGPGALPLEVLQVVQEELLDYHGTGQSILEMSHRSSEFDAILNNLKSNLTSMLNIPSNYTVLFLQGGATLQFAMVANLFKETKKPCDYIVSGVWSQKALEEAVKLGFDTNLVINIDGKSSLPDRSSWKWSDDPAYVYFCDNETVNGIEFPQNYISDYLKNKNIICDMSSNFLSREVDVGKYAIIFAGAQKNLGPAGVTAVIIRNDLLLPTKGTPTMLDFSIMAKHNSAYNTPPVFSIYVSDLVLQWLVKRYGNLKNLNDYHLTLALKVYSKIVESNGFYISDLNDTLKSRINIVFRICKNGVPSNEYEKKFVGFCKERDIIQVEGHRMVGGMRISIYNAMDTKNIDNFIKCMDDFQKMCIDA